MRTLDEVLKENIPGLYYGNRVLFPFSADILKVVFGSEIITDFNGTNHGAKYRITDSFTEIYFLDLRNLYDQMSKYSKVKVTLVETGKDVFAPINHISLLITVKENHQLGIEKMDENTLYFE